MKRLREFGYHEPATLDEAISILAASADPHILAGGTDLLVDLKTERITAATVVNLKGIPGLSGVELVDGGMRVGALTKVTALEASSAVRDRHPALAAAASVLASPPVRSLATIGGNVGRASPASDLGPALIVSGAVARIEGRGGRRDEPVEDLYIGPGATTLAVSDIITSFFLPDPPAGFGSAHRKIGKRGSGTDIAIAGVSAGVVLGGSGSVDSCRIALASLGPTPLRARRSETHLCGSFPTAAVLAEVSALASSEARPIDDLRATAAYRRTLARVLTLRALQGAIAAAGGEVAA